MSKRKSNSSKRNAPMSKPISYLETGDDGDVTINVSLRSFIEIDIDGVDHPVELNRWEAIKLGEALIKAGRRFDGDR